MWRWERVKCEVMRPQSGCSCVMSNRTHTGERAHTLTHTHTLDRPSRGDSRMTNDKVTNVSPGGVGQQEF